MLGGVTLDMNSAGAEEAADRALSAVARKLDAALSVEHTVNELIHEASDPANLCMMYQGQCARSLSSMFEFVSLLLLIGWSPFH